MYQSSFQRFTFYSCDKFNETSESTSLTEIVRGRQYSGVGKHTRRAVVMYFPDVSTVIVSEEESVET